MYQYFMDSFRGEQDYNKHMKFHTGETVNVYQCDTCQKTFSHQKNLVQHMKIHQGVTKQYKCPECPASYSYKCHLTRHLMIHTGQYIERVNDSVPEFHGQRTFIRAVKKTKLSHNLDFNIFLICPGKWELDHSNAHCLSICLSLILQLHVLRVRAVTSIHMFRLQL